MWPTERRAKVGYRCQVINGTTMVDGNVPEPRLMLVDYFHIHITTAMNKPLIIAVLCCATITAQAQLQVNPQIGLTYQNITANEPGVTTKANAGFQIGLDFRIGERFYFQPGLHFARNVTALTLDYPDTTIIQYNIVRSFVKMKALVGYNLLQTHTVKLRAIAGPTYDVLLSVDHTGDPISFSEDDYAKGSFNIDGGLGVDILFLTAETGVSYGLTHTLKDSSTLSSDAKYFTWYLTLGVVFGSGMEGK